MNKIIIIVQFFIIFKVTSIICVHSATDTKRQINKKIVPKLLKYPLFRQLLLARDSTVPDLTSISIFKKI